MERLVLLSTAGLAQPAHGNDRTSPEQLGMMIAAPTRPAALRHDLEQLEKLATCCQAE